MTTQELKDAGVNYENLVYPNGEMNIIVQQFSSEEIEVNDNDEGDNPLSIISKIAYARTEAKDFDDYRKAILDACGMVEHIKESDPNA